MPDDLPLTAAPVPLDRDRFLRTLLRELSGTLEDVVEPFLIQRGFLMRTARGRVAARQAYLHLGLAVPERAGSAMPLFEDTRK